jgi:hypothetical protein
MDFSAWTRQGLVTEWLRGSLANFKWLFPIAGAGAAIGVVELVQAARAKRRIEPSVLLAILLVCGLLASVIVMLNPPFPRTLVPILPVWICALALLTLHGVRAVLRRQNLAVALIGAALGAVIVFASPAGERCKGSAGSGDKFDYDLCHQYFRDAYHPEQVLDFWASLPERLPIVSDFEGFHAIRILNSPAQVFEYRYYPAKPAHRPLIVAHGSKDMFKMSTALGLDPATYSLAADTGYFKVYRYSALP